MNILLTCAGRRNYLVQYFMEALKGRGKMFAVDSNPDAAALQEADESILVPLLGDPEYFDILRSICRENRIRLLLSLNDLELPLLAEQRKSFLEIGTIPVVSEPEVIDVGYDKYRTCEYLSARGIGVPQTYTTLEDAREAIARGDIAFPLMIKPRWGTASIGIEYVEDIGELESAYVLAKKRIKRSMLAETSMKDFERSILIQEFLDGEEYNLNIVNDLNGKYAATLAIRKLTMRAGETDRAITVDNKDMQALGAKIGSTLGHVGNLDCDVFVIKGKSYVFDMNPRFGGAYPFSHVAGANIPAALIAWANGEEPDPDWLRLEPGVTSSKCDRLVVKKQLRAGAISVAELGPRLGELEIDWQSPRESLSSEPGELS
ncbi:MAG: ATP-grasp domain-containing protein [Actinomycetota bacterium]|nr:ATP-grasp domain-containing protein [Actinomycetota bacterium]